MENNPFALLILELGSTSSRLEKERILAEAVKSDQKLFFKGLKYALESLYTFGVSKATVPEKNPALKKYWVQQQPYYSWEEFDNLQASLASRELTGHRARAAIQDACNRSTAFEWNYWYRRILLKNLDCGVTEKTVNKVLTSAGKLDWVIPEFNCQLATDISALPAASFVLKQVLVEPKLDGVRCLAVIREDEIELFSRNGRKLENFPHIVNELRCALDKYPSMAELIFDGEIISESFQSLMTQVNRKSNVKSADAVYHVFDVFELNDFLEGKVGKISQLDRSAGLRSMIDHIKTNLGIGLDHVVVVDQQLIELQSLHKDSEAIFDLRTHATNKGYEGIILKDPNAPYEYKRSKAWIKVKPFIELTMKIVAVEEGSGKYQGCVGSFVCTGHDENGNLVETNVGSGLSDDIRKIDLVAAQAFIGQLVEVQADAVTKSLNKNIYSLRFPRFKCFRTFSGLDELKL